MRGESIRRGDSGESRSVRVHVLGYATREGGEGVVHAT